MLALLFDPSAWLSFVTLSMLEIVLGIDNIVFLSILAGRLPPQRQQAARLGGLALAMLTRIALLLSISWLATLTEPLVQLAGRSFTGRDLVLLSGGLFLLWKGVIELHASAERRPPPAPPLRPRAGVVAVVVQIALVDVAFSLDSVFTAVGVAQHVPVMVAAIVASILVTMAVARHIGDFIATHPGVRVLALAFLILIGVALIADAGDVHIPRGYLYFAMAFSVVVEMINLRMRGRSAPPGP